MPSTGLLVPLPLQLLPRPVLPLSELASLILRGLGSGSGIVMGAAISGDIRDIDWGKESAAADVCSEGEPGHLSSSDCALLSGVTRNARYLRSYSVITTSPG